MAQVEDRDILTKLVAGTVLPKDAIPALLDRSTGKFLSNECQLLDYKEKLNIDQAPSVAELARDLLGFSNTDGGILIIGVADDKSLVGHDRTDFRRLRDCLGPFMGTRVDFDLEECLVSLSGKQERLILVVVRRSLGAYPNVLRKEIELRPGMVRKIKYLRGTIFYRREDETLGESPYGDLESRARELGFSGAAPRTRTSFLLHEDKPGLRLYAPINDRFFGRDAEIAELISKFDDPRGRGVSIAGFGGVGKTELAIRLVSELYRRGKFRTIYSGSAKQTLLGPAGAQQTDPVFIDLNTFLADLAGWLGFNPPKMAVGQLALTCLAELGKLPKVLLFVDNLETVTDRELLTFLDSSLPPNCWVIATARVHKIRNFVYPKELREMDPDDAARLLRHELKRQGLDDQASTPIATMRKTAEKLFCHPLAIRWFAWACKKDLNVWNTGIGPVDVRELENFCVAHTLGNLDLQTQRVLGAILAIGDAADATAESIRHTSQIVESVVELSLWDLECSGLIYAIINEEGVTAYCVAPLAEKPAAELARKNGWEADYVQNFRSYVRRHSDAVPDSPLVRDLLQMEPRKIQDYTREEKSELIARIKRAIPRCPEKHILKLNWLNAECHRHLDLLMTADDLYKECADSVLSKGEPAQVVNGPKILLEAATVAKLRAQTEPQIRRAISYLEAIRNNPIAPLRVLGMLTEMFSIIGDRPNYEKYRAQAQKYIQFHEDFTDAHLDALNEALERSRAHFERRRGQAR